MSTICLDVDGTLFNTNKEISKRTKDKLIEVQKEGNRIILASGRPTQGLMRIAQELEMEKYHGFLISYNGSQVYDLNTKEILYNQTISVEDVKAVIHHCKQFDGLRIMIDHGDSFYVEDVYDCWIELDHKPFNILQYEAREGNMLLKEVWDLEDFISFPVNKILTTANPDYLNQHAKALAQPFKEKLNAMFTSSMYFEFTALGIDKAKALAFVQDKFQLKKEEMIAFGDGQNDCTMLEFVGIGIAMGNADPKLKACADKITKSCDEDGIAYALEELL